MSVWVCTGARTGHQVSSSIILPYGLEKGSLTELEACFCQAGCQASSGEFYDDN